MQIDDLRDYLDILEEYQEVQRIDAEVDSLTTTGSQAIDLQVEFCEGT